MESASTDLNPRCNQRWLGQNWGDGSAFSLLYQWEKGVKQVLEKKNHS